jgi:hypothetical protein
MQQYNDGSSNGRVYKHLSFDAVTRDSCFRFAQQGTPVFITKRNLTYPFCFINNLIKKEKRKVRLMLGRIIDKSAFFVQVFKVF